MSQERIIQWDLRPLRDTSMWSGDTIQAGDSPSTHSEARVFFFSVPFSKSLSAPSIRRILSPNAFWRWRPPPRAGMILGLPFIKCAAHAKFGVTGADEYSDASGTRHVCKKKCPISQTQREKPLLLVSAMVASSAFDPTR